MLFGQAKDPRRRWNHGTVSPRVQQTQRAKVLIFPFVVTFGNSSHNPGLASPLRGNGRGTVGSWDMVLVSHVAEGPVEEALTSGHGHTRCPPHRKPSH